MFYDSSYSTEGILLISYLGKKSKSTTNTSVNQMLYNGSGYYFCCTCLASFCHLHLSNFENYFKHVIFFASGATVSAVRATFP